MRKGGNFMKIRKKMAGTIAMIMALSLGYNAGGPVVVHAHENAVITEKLGETAASQEGVIDFSAIKDNEDLEVADYLPSDINDMEKICTEDYSVNLVDMADNTEDNKTVNDNPNDAKAISLGTQVYDTVATELEQRWYAFSVAKATKFTAAMVMDDTADFDLYVYKLNETIKDKILIISFDMNYSDTCSNQDTTVTINGVKNKLTCKEWRYYNQNKNFKYVISNFDSLDKLKITLTKGRYKISNIKAYIINNTMKKYTSLDNIKVNQKNSTITASTDLKNNGYVITSIPYDEGFEVYIDNKKCEIEKVNTAFLGFKINKGKHIIRIKYKSPLLNYGYILSGCGLIALITLFIFEHRKNNT